MKFALLALAAAGLGSCARPAYVARPDSYWDAVTIPHAQWQRIEARVRKESYPRPALGLLSDFDRGTVERNMRSPFIGITRSFTILNPDLGRHFRTIGLQLDRDIPADASLLAAILCGEAPDPHAVKILSIEILGVLPEHENRTGNNFTVIFRSR